MKSSRAKPTAQLCIAIALGILLGVTTIGCRIASESAEVAHDELGPKALLAKYQWFKDASAALDRKQADISIYERRLESLELSYKRIPRNSWSREDREQYNIWLSELLGIKGSYNQIAAQYNAQMAKANWRFANVGTLPPGAETPLPKEYKPYQNQ